MKLGLISLLLLVLLIDFYSQQLCQHHSFVFSIAGKKLKFSSDRIAVNIWFRVGFGSQTNMINLVSTCELRD